MSGKKDSLEVAVATDPEKLERPRRIIFVIAANNPENGHVGNFYMPGMSLGIGNFQRSSPLKLNMGGTRYTTGFEYDEIYYDESVPQEQREAYQKEVRVARKWLERTYGSLDSGRIDLWKERRAVINDLEKVYDTSKDEDLMFYYNVLGGGYPQIGRNIDDAIRNQKHLYLSVAEDEAQRKSSHRINMLNAKGTLHKISNEWSIDDLLYLCYFLTPKGQHGYSKSTPKPIILAEIEDYIDSIGSENEKKMRPLDFMKAISLFERDRDRARIEGLFNAAMYYGYIIYQSKDRTFLNKGTGFPYGSMKRDAIEKLLNPVNIEELSWLKRKIEQEKWIR